MILTKGKQSARISAKARTHSESGAAMIMVMLALSIFLFIAILFLDIPYLERTGRTIQRAADAASLAAAIQMTRRGSGIPQDQHRGWIFAKRAIIGLLRENPIAGLENIVIPTLPSGGSGNIDPLENSTSPYAFSRFSIASGAQSIEVTISRGVYERPGAGFNMNSVIFYPLEVGDVDASGRSFRGTGRDAGNCIPNSGFPTVCDPAYGLPEQGLFLRIPDGILNRYHYCRPLLPAPYDCQNNSVLFRVGGPPFDYDFNTRTFKYDSVSATGFPPVEYVADGARVTITASGIPTLFAKILGFNTFTSITRTSTSGPE